MAPLTLTSLVLGVWLVVVGLLYALLVPASLTTLNFLFVAAVLLVLALVMIAKWRGSGAVSSIGNVLYDTEHPVAKK